ncbi:pyridoxamine 5'-phosphate oxidase family protein [Brassicibacter mesophilus]|uniref:pyridoxamine 5'-phosphate oxidase family protein n=1 Tax=Brassicibacter mesophilus TaxID=745119 RepID=UPI003D231A30
MFKEMRKAERKITDLESYEILENGEYGVLSTIGTNGYAYGVPVSYVLLNNCIYFHCATEGSKLENISTNNKVSFCVIGKTEILPEKFSTKYESVIIFGKAVEVYNEEKEDALEAIINKYSRDYLEVGKTYINTSKNKTKVIKIIVEHITGKARR